MFLFTEKKKKELAGRGKAERKYDYKSLCGYNRISRLTHILLQHDRHYFLECILYYDMNGRGQRGRPAAKAPGPNSALIVCALPSEVVGCTVTETLDEARDPREYKKLLLCAPSCDTNMFHEPVSNCSDN